MSKADVLPVCDSNGVVTVNVDAELHGGSVVCRFDGELDLDSADDFRREIEAVLDRHSGRRLVIDFSRLAFIDSSGIGALLAIYKMLEGEDRTMTVVVPDSPVRRVLDASGLGSIMTFARDVNDAAAATGER